MAAKHKLALHTKIFSPFLLPRVCIGLCALNRGDEICPQQYIQRHNTQTHKRMHTNTCTSTPHARWMGAYTSTVSGHTPLNPYTIFGYSSKLLHNIFIPNYFISSNLQIFNFQFFTTSLTGKAERTHTHTHCDALYARYYRDKKPKSLTQKAPLHPSRVIKSWYIMADVNLINHSEGRARKPQLLIIAVEHAKQHREQCSNYVFV